MDPNLNLRPSASRGRRSGRALVWMVGPVAVLVAGCGGGDDRGSSPNIKLSGAPNVVVTTSILGALVSDAVGDSIEVTVLIPDGTDPHSWEPSAADVEALAKADLVIANGLGLEESLEEALDERRSSGRLLFDASTVIDEFDGDPHYWTDPTQMVEVVDGLADYLAEIGVDAAEPLSILREDLTTIDSEIADWVADVPTDRRVLVTGHDSMAYFARRYGFEVVGAVVPGRTTRSEATASDIADLADKIEGSGVDVIFTEIGTPADVADALASDVGARVVEIDPVGLPEGDSSYADFIGDLARTVVDALTEG